MWSDRRRGHGQIHRRPVSPRAWRANRGHRRTGPAARPARQPALADIQAAFGKKVIGPTGELKRAELAQIIFADAKARKELEAILHPRIRESGSPKSRLGARKIVRSPSSSFRCCLRRAPNRISTRSFASPVPPQPSANGFWRAAGRRNKSSGATPPRCPLNKRSPAPILWSGPTARSKFTRGRWMTSFRDGAGVGVQVGGFSARRPLPFLFGIELVNLNRNDEGIGQGFHARKADILRPDSEPAKSRKS